MAAVRNPSAIVHRVVGLRPVDHSHPATMLITVPLNPSFLPPRGKRLETVSISGILICASYSADVRDGQTGSSIEEGTRQG